MSSDTDSIQRAGPEVLCRSREAFERREIAPGVLESVGYGDTLTDARALKADLLEARSKQERSFAAHNILASAALLERENGSAV